MRMIIIAALALPLGLPACSSTSHPSAADKTPSAASGSSTARAPLSESQIRDGLSDHGYSNISNLHKAGNDWTGSAVDSTGKPVVFDVDDYGVIVIVQ